MDDMIEIRFRGTKDDVGEILLGLSLRREQLRERMRGACDADRVIIRGILSSILRLKAQIAAKYYE